MKALSLWQPWATLVACGVKQFETRDWRTQHRGLVAIHAAKAEDGWKKLNPLQWSELAGMGITGPADVPSGAIVAVASIVRCVPTGTSLMFCLRRGRVDPTVPWSGRAGELRWGNYRPGRWAWWLEDVVAIDPVTVKGSVGLFELEEPDGQLIAQRAAAAAANGSQLTTAARLMLGGGQP